MLTRSFTGGALKLSCLLCSSLFVGLAGCRGSDSLVLPPPGPGVVHGVTVTPQSVQMSLFGTLRFAASVNADPGVDRTVTWTSSNTAVMTVDSTGLATALAAG